MNRTVTWSIGCGSVAVALMCFLRIGGQGQSVGVAEAAKVQPAKKTEASPAPKVEEKIAVTFSSDEKMQEFTKLWGQRQSAIVRMTVLQAYWNQEQAMLAQLNTKITTDYKLDATKNYSLDAKRRVLLEREPTPVSMPGSDAGHADQSAPANKQ